LIELALDAAGVHPSVYCAPEDFDRLADEARVDRHRPRFR
jgi:hypothetical protein